MKFHDIPYQRPDLTRALKDLNGLIEDFKSSKTLDEANHWWRNGNGEPLFVDASKIDLSPVNTRLLENNSGQHGITYVNFAHPHTANFETGPVYGTIAITLLSSKDGSVTIGNSKTKLLDNYGFEMHEGRPLRNFLTKIGENEASVGGKYKGKSFDIFSYGNAQKVKVIK